MLKTYATIDEVPEAIREHYRLRDGRYVPELSDDHPDKANSVKLLNEKTAAETKVAGLEAANTSLKADLESAKSHSLPRNHVAVLKPEVETWAVLKEHGTAAEIVTKLAEHKTLREDADKRTREDNLRAVAKELDYNPDAFVLLSNLPEFEIKEAGGKKTVVAKVKEGENVVEKPAQGHIEASYAPFMASLRAKGGVSVPEQRRGNEPAGDIYTRLREQTKAEGANPAGINTITERFGFGKVAAQV